MAREETHCCHIGYSFQLADRITHNTAFLTPVVEHWLERHRNNYKQHFVNRFLFLFFYFFIFILSKQFVYRDIKNKMLHHYSVYFFYFFIYLLVYLYIKVLLLFYYYFLFFLFYFFKCFIIIIR